MEIIEELDSLIADIQKLSALLSTCANSPWTPFDMPQTDPGKLKSRAEALLNIDSRLAELSAGGVVRSAAADIDACDHTTQVSLTMMDSQHSSAYTADVIYRQIDNLIQTAAALR
ncbi:hypothetical protein [Chromobacterium vaccinii]|uniref:hypothetical protein n=1 Tax=Chromobacterium vaccinii TaxID=1108595 RepID=UPI0011AB3040|nr:hypothetical protein [Chromobacterium vaccinii]